MKSLGEWSREETKGRGGGSFFFFFCINIYIQACMPENFLSTTNTNLQ